VVDTPKSSSVGGGKGVSKTPELHFSCEESMIFFVTKALSITGGGPIFNNEWDES
jgi:hypothetical protein